MLISTYPSSLGDTTQEHLPLQQQQENLEKVQGSQPELQLPHWSQREWISFFLNTSSQAENQWKKWKLTTSLFLHEYYFQAAQKK